MKKLVSVLMALLLVLGTVPLRVAAAENEGSSLTVEQVPMYGGYVEAEAPTCLGVSPQSGSAHTLSTGTYDIEEAARVLRDNLVDYKTEFDVSSCHIPLDQRSPLWQYTKDRYGELFHAVTFGCTYNEVTNEVVSITNVQYSMTAEEYAAAKKTFDGKIDAIVSQVEGLSDLQKVLLVHDYLAANFEYDVEGLESGNTIHDAYTFLTGGIGVCQAYTLTFETVMDRLGIPVSYVSSQALNHIWNMVQIGGQWYQLDITHDDPVIDNLGAVRHTRFLVSDSKMKEIKEDPETPGSITDWKYGLNVDCTDTAYETWFWTETSSPFVYHKPTGAWYCVCSGTGENGLCQWDGSGDDCTLVKGVSSLSGWTSDGKPSSFSAGLAAYGGSLYFSAPDGVYLYDLKTQKLSKPVEVENYYNKDRIHGLRISGNTLYYDYRTAASKWARTIKTLPLSLYTDVNGIYGWYAEDNAVYIHIPEETQQAVVMIAWYDGSKLVKTQMCTVPGDYTSVGAEGCRYKIMALSQENYSPLCGAVAAEPAA